MKKVTILLQESLHEQLKALSLANHRSLQGQLVFLIESAIKEAEEAEHGK